MPSKEWIDRTIRVALILYLSPVLMLVMIIGVCGMMTGYIGRIFDQGSSKTPHRLPIAIKANVHPRPKRTRVEQQSRDRTWP